MLYNKTYTYIFIYFVKHMYNCPIGRCGKMSQDIENIKISNIDNLNVLLESEIEFIKDIEQQNAMQLKQNIAKLVKVLYNLDPNITLKLDCNALYNIFYNENKEIIDVLEQLEQTIEKIDQIKINNNKIILTKKLRDNEITIEITIENKEIKSIEYKIEYIDTGDIIYKKTIDYNNFYNSFNNKEDLKKMISYYKIRNSY